MPRATARLQVTTAFLAIAAGLVGFASLEFMLEAIQEDFSMTPDQTIVVGQISSGASLFAVFLAGALADRFGDRPVLEVASVAAALGAIVVGVAPDYRVLLGGLCLSGIGTIAMAIAGLSVLGTTYPDRADRARAFGIFAVVAPVVSIVVPMAAGVLVPGVGWRSVVALWLAVAVATFVLSCRSLSVRAVAKGQIELVTPMLAGVALAGIALSVSFVNTKSESSAHSVPP
ncbi:MAG: MFS transporter [Actinomycetales bacterium]